MFLSNQYQVNIDGSEDKGVNLYFATFSLKWRLKSGGRSTLITFS